MDSNNLTTVEPRRLLAFDPSDVTAAVVTCRRALPGTQRVIRSLTLTLRYSYGDRRVLGFRYGFAGIARPIELTPLELTAPVVTDVHAHGGTILGSSRGPQDVATMLDTLVRDGVSILFCIGGDGTLRGARRRHAVIVAAEGAGQELSPRPTAGTHPATSASRHRPVAAGPAHRRARRAFTHWLICTALASGVLWADEAKKTLGRRSRRR